MTIKETQQQIIEEFSIFQDWMDKYEYLIELGKSLPVIQENAKSESNLIKGCQSRVWLNAEYSGNKLYFTADSDAIITKGIISLLVRVFSDKTPDEILKSDINFLQEIGLNDNLSPTRANGLLSMVKQIKYYAAVYSQINENS
ncbi:MAG: SufE family protein [Bacteroidales bacterium]